MNRCILLLVLFGLPTMTNAAEPVAEQPMPAQTDVFVSGSDGYRAYRIPVIETAPDGSLLAFAEARKHNLGDPGMENNDIDLVCKRSSDAGRTWSAMKVIEDPGELWSAANAATVVDRQTGRVWLHYLRCKPGKNTDAARPGTDDVQNLVRTSDDNGQTWSDPIDLTSVARDMKDPNWRCSVPGPGGAIQDQEGRLIVPIWKVAPSDVLAIFSEDHGKTWKRGQTVPANGGGDENQLVELADGRILMDYRQNSGAHRWSSAREVIDGQSTGVNGGPHAGSATSSTITTSSVRTGVRTAWCRQIGSSKPPRPCCRRSRNGWRPTPWNWPGTGSPRRRSMSRARWPARPSACTRKASVWCCAGRVKVGKRSS